MLFLIQLVATVATAAFAGLVTFLLLTLLDRTMGIKSDEQDQDEGMDLVEHGEKGYHELG
jgi:Amt family ammonium transporter